MNETYAVYRTIDSMFNGLAPIKIFNHKGNTKAYARRMRLGRTAEERKRKLTYIVSTFRTR